MKTIRCLCGFLGILSLLSIGCFNSKHPIQKKPYKVLRWRVVGGTLEKKTNITKNYEIIDDQITVEADGHYTWSYRYRSDETKKVYEYNGVLPEEIDKDLWELINRYYKKGKRARIPVQRQDNGMLVLRCDRFGSSTFKWPQAVGELWKFLHSTHVGDWLKKNREYKDIEVD